MTVNDTTNSLTTRIIFGKNRKPQGEFCYRNLAEPVKELDPEVFDFLTMACPEMMAEKHSAATIPFNAEDSYLPYFWGYEYKFGKSTYRDEEVGEGGYVYSEPGIYRDVALLDIASMHPHSLIAECLFGVKFTTAFRDIVEGRVNIKHEAWTIVNNILDGKLMPYIQKVTNGEMTSDDLANALKTAINSVYGLTSAKFENPFKDPRNVDNIVAKRGALFMVDLKHEVQERGFTVAHIKTDSIKIPNATPEIIQFVMDFGLRYGYTFEHEATYDKMCLVNDAVYIAKYATVERCCELYGEEYVNREKDIIKKNKKKPGAWTATGTQFQVPYVFKTLFSKEDICFDDMCETKSVQTALYLDMNENLVNVEDEELVKSLRRRPDYQDNPLSKQQRDILQRWSHVTDTELEEMILKGHDYHFVGRVGQFCPMKPGSGGGILLRETIDKNTGEHGFSSATGAKGYRWMESEMVRTLGKEAEIDRSYYDKLIDEAVESIGKYDDFEWFVSDESSR